MAQTILLKRGVQTDIAKLTLEYGEVALAYNADKTAIALYGGDGNGGLVLINPDVSDDINSLESTLSSLSDTVDGIVSTGGEANKIEAIKVNGTEQTITDKTVDITVPTTTSELTNDSDYQTSTQVAAAIAAIGHASMSVVESVPDAADAESNIMYLVMNSETGYYDIYVLISGEVVRIDDTSIDLSNYATKTALSEEISARESADTELQTQKNDKLGITDTVDGGTF